jgi:RNA polymerase sigma factor (sigma-70 family)
MSSVPTPSDHALPVGSSAAFRHFPRAALLRVASDERLVELVRGGSEAAFEAIYDRHHRGILAFCRHMLASADEGEDALQHTFMAAYRHLVDGSAEIQLRPWLYAIARNRCLTMLRARRERPLADHEAPATEHLSTEAQRRQDVRDLLGDVARLPEDQRAALVLAELGAVSHDEIALVLNVPRQKVKALVFQARTSLAASRKARETPCEEIREQVANLRGGALRRTTLHRHLRECAGCRAFRDEVALQRKTLAVALPVIPTAGLKEAALGAAFGSGSAGGGAAAASASSALAAKALVTVALVGGGTTAGVEATRHAVPLPKAPERSVPAAPPAGAIGSAAVARHISSAPPRRTAPAAGARPQPARPGKAAAPPQRREPKPATPVAGVLAPAPAAAHAEPVEAEPAPPPASREAETPAAAPKPEEAPKPEKAPKPEEAPKPEKAPPGQAKKAEPKQQPPGQAKKAAPPAPAAPKLPSGQAKKLVPPSPPKANGTHP